MSTNTLVTFLLGLLAGRYLTILPLGVLGLMRVSGVDFSKMLGIGMESWVSDAVRSMIVVTLVYAAYRAFLRLLAQR